MILIISSIGVTIVLYLITKAFKEAKEITIELDETEDFLN